MLSLAPTSHTCLIALITQPKPISGEFNTVEHTKKDDFFYLGWHETLDFLPCLTEWNEIISPTPNECLRIFLFLLLLCKCEIKWTGKFTLWNCMITAFLNCKNNFPPWKWWILYCDLSRVPRSQCTFVFVVNSGEKGECEKGKLGSSLTLLQHQLRDKTDLYYFITVLLSMLSLCVKITCTGTHRIMNNAWTYVVCVLKQICVCCSFFK